MDLANAQMVKAIDTVTELERAITAFAAGKKAEAERCIQRTFLEEAEVDNLRRSVFEELTKGELPPRYREDLMHLVKRMDVMADHVKDSARSLKILMEAEIPKEILDKNVSMARALVSCAAALRKSIEKLRSDPARARELSLEVDAIEDRIDEDYVKTKSLFIKYAREVDAATLMILKDLVEFMENAADTCADTSDYIKVLAAGEEAQTA